MPRRKIELEGPGVEGRRINAALLRDVLTILIDGSQKAVRLRTQGRSTARGPSPAWISASSEFVVEVQEGSTVLEIEAPTLLSADPEAFTQRDLFPDVDPDRTSFDYFVESLSSVVHGGKEPPLVDPPMIHLLSRVNSLFEQGVKGILFTAASDVGPRVLEVRKGDVAQLRSLEKQIPPPEYVRVAGKLDIIRHSDGTFYLALPSGEKVRGIAQGKDLEALQHLWGKQVVAAGTAYFSPDGDLLRIEADLIGAASATDTKLWSIVPEPASSPGKKSALRIPQGPRSGLNAIFGKWPGEEDDDALRVALEEAS